jgi:hypothetical protein
MKHAENRQDIDNYFIPSGKKTDPNTPTTSANVEEPPTLRTILIEMRCSQNRKSSSIARENT